VDDILFFPAFQRIAMFGCTAGVFLPAWFWMRTVSTRSALTEMNT